MKTRAYVEQAQQEVDYLNKQIDDIVNKYIAESNMPQNQKMVNIGRALNAYHLAWVGNISKQLEDKNESIEKLIGKKSPTK